MKIYLSGPMTGLPEYNYRTFNYVAARLRRLGHEVYNPAEYPYDGPKDKFPVREAFAEYCTYILKKADVVVMLPGWTNSQVAWVEHDLAKRCGVRVRYVL